MKNKKNFSFNISNFETVSLNIGEKLIGGFTASITNNKETSLETISNNCFGGNCTWGCGDGKNIGCNTVSGCGVITGNG